MTNPSSANHLLASDIYKANVYGPSEHKIGDISDLMIDSNGNVTAAIISVGGVRLKRSSDLSDQLESFRAAVDFETFRPTLKAALLYFDVSQECPSFGP